MPEVGILFLIRKVIEGARSTRGIVLMPEVGILFLIPAVDSYVESQKAAES